MPMSAVLPRHGRRLRAHGAEIIVTPEMYLSGYPCDDLVLRADFMADVAAGIDALAKLTADGGPAIVVGAPVAADGAIYNSVFILDGGAQLARFDKVNLPNYGVFDDKRNFAAGQMPGPAMLRGTENRLSNLRRYLGGECCRMS